MDRLLTYSNVTAVEIQSIIHGAMFTRGPKDLCNTAVFFGGTNVDRTDELFEQAKKCFFGPLRVSMMNDPNGSNTTAAAAVLCATNHVALAGTTVTVLAGTGPVGRRIGQLVAGQGAQVRLCSRSFEKAQSVCDSIASHLEGVDLVPIEIAAPGDTVNAIRESAVVFAAGAAGIELLGSDWQSPTNALKVAVDVNAVPPSGIRGVEMTDAGTERDAKICFGAIGVGRLKMRIHQQAIRRLFETNDAILDLDEIFQIGRNLSM